MLCVVIAALDWNNGRQDNADRCSDGLAASEPRKLALPGDVAFNAQMVAAANLVEIAALVGDTARATALAVLMGGQAATVSELAGSARVGKSTMSEHLARLEAAGLVRSTIQGRFKYFRIASPRVATMLESIIAVAEIDTPPRYQPKSVKDDVLRAARTCYDHLAGRLGVALADGLSDQGFVELTDDGGEVTPDGLAFFRQQKLDIDALKSKRVFCRPCLDWSERRYHIAGVVGACLCRAAFDRGWVTRIDGTRAVSITAAGRHAIREIFRVDFVHLLRPDAALRLGTADT
jgi:DNA-binding transcriptional ArsR family regulator